MAAKQSQSGSSEAVGTESGQPEEIQRWSAARKAAVALDIFKGKATPQGVARQYDLAVLDVEGWVEKFLESGREGLRAVPRDLEARFEAEKKDLLAKVGELTLQVDALKKEDELSQPIEPLGGKRSGAELVNQVVAALREMHKDDALASSISVAAVCRWLSVPRSSAYYLKHDGPPCALGRSTSKSGSLPKGFLLGLIYSIIQHSASFGDLCSLARLMANRLQSGGAARARPSSRGD